MEHTSQDTSGFLHTAADAEAQGGSFCQFSELPSRGYSRLVKAQRYGRWWVLKGLKEEYRHQTLYRQLLHKEFDITIGLSLQHPAIVAVTGFEEVEGLGECIVMEWVDGVTLGEWLSTSPRSKRERRRIFEQLLDAMAYVHAHQVAHRDLKPSNILVTRNGQQVKLIDFGLSDSDSYTFFKQPVGTRGYVSPEQQTDSTADLRNDIYSLGCVLQDLRLGCLMNPIVRRCLSPIAQRYTDADALRRAFLRASRIPYYIYSLAAVVCLAALLAVAPLPRFMRQPPADETQVWNKTIKEGNIFYTINNVQHRTVEVTGAIPDEEGRLTIPDSVEYDGTWYRVHYLGDYALENGGVREVQLPSTLEIVGQFALFGNPLTSVTLPEATYSILRGAFHSCQELERIELGSSVAVIDLDAFTGCHKLRDIIIHTPVPPVFAGISVKRKEDITVHVPAEAVELYRQNPDWKDCNIVPF